MPTAVPSPTATPAARPRRPADLGEIAAFAWQDRTLTANGRAPRPFPPAVERWRPLVTRLLADNALLPADLVLAVIQQESGGTPRAVSYVGAMGLMQLMPATCAEFERGDPYGPTTNIRAGIGYLTASMKLQRGSLYWTVASYNAGAGAMQEIRNGFRTVPAWFGAGETLNHVNTVTASYSSHRPQAPN